MEDSRRKTIFDKTDGHCHLCHGKLAYSNYGSSESRGGWEVEHSIPRAKGGSDHLNNLFASHISCNRTKGIMTSRTARASYGNTRAPYSRDKKRIVKNENITLGAIVGFAVGSFLGPAGRIIGASLGALLGGDLSPRK